MFTFASSEVSEVPPSDLAASLVHSSHIDGGAFSSRSLESLVDQLDMSE